MSLEQSVSIPAVDIAAPSKKSKAPRNERLLVFEGKRKKTKGGLEKKDLMMTPDGRIISVKKHNNGKIYAEKMKKLKLERAKANLAKENEVKEIELNNSPVKTSKVRKPLPEAAPSFDPGLKNTRDILAELLKQEN